MTNREAAIERMALVLAPRLEGGREFDQMPPDRQALRKWNRTGMCSINDATRDDAIEAAQAAYDAMHAEAVEGHEPTSSPVDDRETGVGEQRPVAWMYDHNGTPNVYAYQLPDWSPAKRTETPLYTADQLAALSAKVERLEAVMRRCALIVERNLHRQNEKIGDVPLLIRAALATEKRP